MISIPLWCSPTTRTVDHGDLEYARGLGLRLDDVGGGFDGEEGEE